MYAQEKMKSAYHFGRPVYKTDCPMLSDRCLSYLVYLSVTLVYCGQMVGWVKMPLGMEVGLGQVGPGPIVLAGTQLPPNKGAQQLPTFRPCLLFPNGWMDQDAN